MTVIVIKNAKTPIWPYQEFTSMAEAIVWIIRSNTLVLSTSNDLQWRRHLYMTQAAIGLPPENPKSCVIHLIRRSWFSCTSTAGHKTQIRKHIRTFQSRDQMKSGTKISHAWRIQFASTTYLLLFIKRFLWLFFRFRLPWIWCSKSHVLRRIADCKQHNFLANFRDSKTLPESPCSESNNVFLPLESLVPHVQHFHSLEFSVLCLETVAIRKLNMNK